MRLSSFASLAAVAAAAVTLAGCGGEPTGDNAAAAARTLEGDGALIASAQTMSDAIGGCARPADAEIESKVVSLESASVVMLACNAQTHRLFAVRGQTELQLISLPDYDASGWFASDQASMAELDAGAGTLTTFRKSADNDGCGSEGTYHWDGAHFALQELRWKECSAEDKAGPPFPVLWPTQQGVVAVDPNGATPAP